MKDAATEVRAEARGIWRVFCGSGSGVSVAEVSE